MKAFLFTAIAVTALISLYFLSNEANAPTLLTHTYNKEFTDLISSSNLEIINPDDLAYRYKIYLKNKQYIESSNKKGLSYSLGLTPNALFDFEEFKAKFSLSTFGSAVQTTNPQDKNITKTSIDWRGKLDKTPVRTQTTSCNAGYAMSVSGVLESFVQKYRSQSVPLSPQQILDCSINFGNQGCRGGYADKALDYIAQIGISTEHDYPYMARDQQCGRVQPYAGHKGYLKAYDEKDIKRALMSMPMVVALEINQDLMHYTGGVYSNKSCGSNLNHFGLAVGFSENWVSSDYWIIKNSFGSAWGEKGYLLLELYSCGVAKNAFNVYLRE